MVGATRLDGLSSKIAIGIGIGIEKTAQKKPAWQGIDTDSDPDTDYSFLKTLGRPFRAIFILSPRSRRVAPG